MSLPDATIELNLPEEHAENLVEGESVMINVNAFKQLDGVHVRLGAAKVDELPLVKSNTTHSLFSNGQSCLLQNRHLKQGLVLSQTFRLSDC